MWKAGHCDGSKVTFFFGGFFYNLDWELMFDYADQITIGIIPRN